MKFTPQLLQQIADTSKQHIPEHLRRDDILNLSLQIAMVLGNGKMYVEDEEDLSTIDFTVCEKTTSGINYIELKIVDDKTTEYLYAKLTDDVSTFVEHETFLKLLDNLDTVKELRLKLDEWIEKHNEQYKYI